MEEADRRVEADGLERRADVVDQERVDEREQGVDGIERWAPAPAVEAEAFLLRPDQVVESAEVDVRRLAFEAAERVGPLRALGAARNVVRRRSVASSAVAAGGSMRSR